MRTLALRVAPQRNSQYTELARALAEPEVRRSPLRHVLSSVERFCVGDADYLRLGVEDDAEAVVARVVPHLAATSDAFWVDGPSWYPVPVVKTAAVPRTMVETRRYSGKTNELFTRVLVNLALFDRSTPGRVLDPMCGGGTTVFAALERGAAAVGADAERSAVEGTARFAGQFLREHGIRVVESSETHRGRGRDWHLSLDGTDPTLRASFLQADLDEVAAAMVKIPGGQRVHAVVADLPYGIQHGGRVAELFGKLFAVADEVLTGDGVFVAAWNSSRVGADVVAETPAASRFVLDPTDDLDHRVDRVIKRRSVLVARRPPS